VQEEAPSQSPHEPEGSPEPTGLANFCVQPANCSEGARDEDMYALVEPDTEERKPENVDEDGREQSGDLQPHDSELQASDSQASDPQQPEHEAAEDPTEGGEESIPEEDSIEDREEFPGGEGEDPSEPAEAAQVCSSVNSWSQPMQEEEVQGGESTTEVEHSLLTSKDHNVVGCSR